MRFLLDTHAFLWAVSAPDRLRHSGFELIVDSANTVVFSAISALEIAIKVSAGKLKLPEHASDYVNSRVDALSMDVLPVYVSHALQVASLPVYHSDPFDRLLVAQCQIEKLPLMTADAALVEYDVEIIWIGEGRAPRRRRRRATASK
ncbi:MAG TPA: type II toxin-antitoxin system VapC family toxin [Thermoanaerobaculia bacterium]|nr:type II toxin-antitoxin system VapC family toxin [Thermoanaerobaculia bacterium]